MIGDLKSTVLKYLAKYLVWWSLRFSGVGFGNRCKDILGKVLIESNIWEIISDYPKDRICKIGGFHKLPLTHKP